MIEYNRKFSLELTSYRINFLKSKDYLTINADQWGEEPHKILYVTGLAGSGKSHLTYWLAHKYKAINICLDALKFYDQSNASSQQVVDDFIKIYPEVEPFVKSIWKNGNTEYEDQLYTIYTRKFLSYIKNRAYSQNIRYIVEGIHLFIRLNPCETIGEPTIIVGTSLIKSVFNKIMRDYYTKIKTMSSFFDDMIIYQFRQRRYLNKYLQEVEYHDRIIQKMQQYVILTQGAGNLAEYIN